MEYRILKCDDQDFSEEHIKQQMTLIMYADWVGAKCPCGAEMSGRYTSREEKENFLDEHVPHSNGFCREEHSDDWNKFYIKKPPTFTYKIIEEK